MSECENNFTKVTVPVNSLPANAPDTLKDMARQFVYDDENSKIDICVKKCNSGSIPYNRYDLDSEKKLEFTDQNLIHGADFVCFDNPSTDFIKNKATYNIIYKCPAGILKTDNISGGQAKCVYVPDQYILKR